MRSNTGWLFAKAREDAISKVIGEELKGYARVMDLNNEGLEKLVPASRDAMLVHLQDTLSERCQDYVRGLNALIAFDGVDPNVLQQASGYLEKQGVFCYMEETTFRDWAYLYSSLLPWQTEVPPEFNKWLDSMGFSVTGQGIKYGTKTFFKRDAPVHLPRENLHMYDLVDGGMVVYGVYYVISKMM